MLLEWFGNNFIRLQTKSPQNGDSNLLIDPYQTKTLGLRQPKMDAVLALLTNATAEQKKLLASNTWQIDHPGEYEINQIFVYGIGAVDKEGKSTGRVMYVIEAEDMTIGHLGSLQQTELTDTQLEYIEDVDILCLPVGGGDSLSASQAARIVQQVSPRIVVPMNYSFNKSKSKLDKVDSFIKEFGGAKQEKVDKLRLSKKDLPQEEVKLVIINL